MPRVAEAKPKPKSKATVAVVPILPKRQILYPRIEFFLGRGDDAITVEKAMELIGWQEVNAENRNDGPEPTLTDRYGVKIRLLNNTINRSFYMSKAEELVQTILMLRWNYNGEDILIGKTGLVLNGQHTLVAIILAEQDRTREETELHWRDNWPGPIKIEKSIKYGLEESDEVVNTMDTCKPRSLEDVIYRTAQFRIDNEGKPLKNSEVKKLSRMMAAAISLTWERTGAVNDPYAPRRTHAEAMDFLRRHERMADAVRHIRTEDKVNGTISNYISPGVASGLLYLMAASSTDQVLYHSDDVLSEKNANFDRWDEACEFWTLLGDTKSVDLQEVRYAIGALFDEDRGTTGTRLEKLSIICKAWNAFINGEKLTQRNVALHEGEDFETDEYGRRHLIDPASVGGIDLGVPKSEDPGDDDDENPEEEEESEREAAPKKGRQPTLNGPLPSDPSPEEVKKEREAIRKGHLEAMKEKPTDLDEPKTTNRKPGTGSPVASSGPSGGVPPVAPGAKKSPEKPKGNAKKPTP